MPFRLKRFVWASEIISRPKVKSKDQVRNMLHDEKSTVTYNELAYFILSSRVSGRKRWLYKTLIIT